jgi:hypothetical protein
MRRLVVPLIAIALLVAGCGGYGNSKQKQPAGTGGTTTSKRVPAY